MRVRPRYAWVAVLGSGATGSALATLGAVLHFCKFASLTNKNGDGRRERIRTSGPYVPNVVLYQAELLSDIFEGLWGHLAGAPL